MTGRRPQEMPCQEFVECLTDYLEGALGDDDRMRLEAHLSICEDCTRYLDQLRTTRRLAGELRPDDVTPAMRDGLMAAFARWSAGEEPGTSGTSGSGAGPG